MESSATNSPTPDANSRRRSGRVVRAPDKFSPEPQVAKRKRGIDQDDDDVENGAPSDAEMSDESGASSPDEDAPAPRRSKASQSGRPKKPALKKPKTNGAHPGPSSHATNLARRPKTVKIANPAGSGDGLYAEIFGSGLSSQDVATQWYSKYQANEVQAQTELVNCVLQCAGCDQKVTEDDIRDPDNCPNRLNELQSIYQEQQITDYPLLTKTRTAKSFRDLLTGFFLALVDLLHETEVLYKDEALMQNLHTWVAPMSSSTLRPFRHTASTIALAIQSGVVDVAKVLDQRITSIEAQKAAAQKAKNRTKLAEIQRNLDETNGNRQLCNIIIKDFFDTVFVHRYRDVDPRIRTECVEALGGWVWVLPKQFEQPEYLRYLGWMLSDVMHSTRLEVLKQLTRIFNRDAHKLGHFIDRFRPRLLEMAIKDSDVSVRVASIGVMEIFRAAGMLEPTELDSIGKLMFDTDIRIRKAVVNFFVACVQDSVDGKVEILGGSQALEEHFAGVDDEDTESPRPEWIDIKCLAENLAAYDALLEDKDAPRGLDVVADVVQATAPETRLSLASQVLYEKVPEVNNWEMIVGYLLFDHTTSSRSRSKSKANVFEAAFKSAVAPEGREEFVLLEVLGAAVKASLSQAVLAEHDKGKKKLSRVEVAELQEHTALRLAAIIPRLLNKFGADANTATVVLRLEHLLDFKISQHLRQESLQYEKLLDEISTQFNRHSDKRVLAEAASALLHARQYDELEEMTDSRLSVLWENIINSLRNFDKTCELTIRGNLDEAALRELSTILMKISKLASISDCIDILETEGRSADSSATAIEILADTVQRGRLEQDDEELSDLEDEVTSFAIKSCQFYFMWKILRLSKLAQSGAEVPDAMLDNVAILRDRVSNNLVASFASRAGLDDLRLFSAGSLCDLRVLFASLRSVVERFGPGALAGPSRQNKLGRLIIGIDPDLVPEMISIFDTAERAYAKKANKILNEPGEDEDPIDDDLLEDDEQNDELTQEEKHAGELKAEKALCELAGKYVLAITAKVLDQSGPRQGKLRKRLLRNQTRLGPNFKEVVAYLDEKKLEELARGKSKKAKAPAGKDKEPAKSVAIVADDDEDDPFEDVELEEGSREDLRRRELLDEPAVEDEGEDEQRVNNEVDDDDLLGD